MSKNDDRIIQLKKAVELKKELLKSQSSRFSPITNMSLELNGVRMNLNIFDNEQLILLASQLKAIELGAIAMALTGADVVLSGFKLTDWLADVQSKIAVNAVKDEQSKLARMEAKLKGLLSADKKTELELDELEAMI